MMPHLRNDASPLNIRRPNVPRTERVMGNGPANRSMLKTVLADVQFWVPVAVLVGGLLVLRWIS